MREVQSKMSITKTMSSKVLLRAHMKRGTAIFVVHMKRVLQSRSIVIAVELDFIGVV
jgi:hypothetical protein